MIDVDDKNELISHLAQASAELNWLILQLTTNISTINWSSDRIYNAESRLTSAQGVWDRISYGGIEEDGD